ncbi:MAG: hypothetical protein U1A77_14115 [Pirellulales bacterium]
MRSILGKLRRTALLAAFAWPVWEVPAHSGFAQDQPPAPVVVEENAGADFEYFTETYGARDGRYRTPAMFGDFFAGPRLGFRADSVLDRVMIVADDLDAPFPLPNPANPLTVTENGPVGIFTSSVTSVQQLQALYRAGSPIPPVVLVGAVNDNATMTSVGSITDIQNQLAGSPLAYDIILVEAPPGSYSAAAQTVFATRNAIPGATTYDANASGALIQGGVDTLNGGEDLDAFYFYQYVVRFNTALSDVGSGGVGRMKIAENGTVLPQDRVYLRYSNIYHSFYTNGGKNLNRFVPGIERAFLDGLASVEVRVPFATDSATSYQLDGSSFTNGSATRFGSVTLNAKALLVNGPTVAVSGGLGIGLPTASSIRVDYASGEELLRMENEATHLQPFLGMLYTPNDRLFAQGFLQYDIATAGDSVAINTGSGLTTAGRLTDANALYFDAAIGYWLLRSDADSGLTGLVPTIEYHQTVTTGSSDVVTAGPFQVGNFGGSTSVSSIVAGATMEFASRSQLAIGYATQLGGGADRQYDGSLQVNFSRTLGP